MSFVAFLYFIFLQENRFTEKKNYLRLRTKKKKKKWKTEQKHENYKVKKQKHDRNHKIKRALLLRSEKSETAAGKKT